MRISFGTSGMPYQMKKIILFMYVHDRWACKFNISYEIIYQINNYKNEFKLNISTFGCRFLEARNDLNTDTSTSFIDASRRLARRILNAVDNFFVMKLDVPDQHMRE